MFGGRQIEKQREIRTRTPEAPRTVLTVTSTVADMNRLYRGGAVPETKHTEHFKKTERLLWDALSSYAKVTSSRSRADEVERQAATSMLKGVIDQAHELEFPQKILEQMSSKFITVAFDNNRPMPKQIRRAVAHMGNSIGGDRIPLDVRVRTIAKHSRSAKGVEQTTLSGTSLTRDELASAMYANLGVTNVRHAPTIVDRLKDHARPMTLGGVVAAITASAILAPAVAQAAETPSTNTTPSGTNASTTEIGTLSSPSKPSVAVQSPVAITIDASKGKPEDQKPETITAPANEGETPKKVAIELSAKGTLKQDLKPQKISQSTEPASDALTEQTPVAPIITTPPENDATMQPLDEGKLTAPLANPDKKVYSNIDPSTGVRVETTIPSAPPVAISEIVKQEDGDASPLVKAPIESLTAPADPLESFINAGADPSLPTTPEQDRVAQNIQMIKRFAVSNDIESASTLVLKSFRDTSNISTEFDENGNPVYAVTNKKLAKNVSELSDSYQSLIAKKGHEDSNEVNTTLVALSVLEAAAIDQSVFNSDEVKKLIEGVAKPSDKYRGKLFDKYLSDAKKILSENNGELSAGMSDANKTQLETMYAYLLLANVSDTEQAKQIQGIKDAEAEAAAKKAAEDAARNQPGKSSKSINIDAINNLVDRSNGRWDSFDGESTRWRALKAMQYLLEHSDYTPTQVAGIVSNLLGESSAMPDRKQTQGGNAKGIAQWEGDRFVNLVRFAEDRGKPWTDFATQMDFILHELKGRGGKELRKSNDLNSATKAFMYVFETPYVVVHGYRTGDWSKAENQASHRASLGQPILDAYNKEVDTINKAREAAKKKADEERKNLTSEENRFKDSTGVKTSPITPVVRNDIGYHRGEKVPIKLCALPNTLYKGGPGLVNARAAEQAYKMFEQMKEDLGLKVIVLNDEYRSMQDQEDAVVKYGNGAARPGWSTHQMGYAFDINMGAANGGNAESYRRGVDVAYPGNPVWEWLKANAHKFGFHQLPDEAWHWSIDGR